MANRRVDLNIKEQYIVSDAAAVDSSNGSYTVPKRNRITSHFRKWWWLHLIVFAVVLLVVALPL
jgi:hypothetical protein